MARSWFAIDGLGTPTLLAGRGTERLSHAWRFDLTITAPEALELERTALGRRASLSIEQGGATRVLHGVVSRVALEESLAHHQAFSERSCRYRVHFVPRLALLQKIVRTRIFQAASVVDIACQVLGQHGIAAERRLVRQHPVRTYCTQYEESDYQFVRRILGEAGIGFYFHAGAPTPDPTPRVAGDSVILIDDANAYQDLGSASATS